MQLADYNLLYNTLSFAIATFGASTVFFFCQRSQVAPAYKTALTLAGLVCLIALYHYLRIFESFNEAYIVINGVITETGGQLNVSYRYVGWLLTVPLLLLELVLVIRLTREETFSLGAKLTVAAVIMVLLGYSGEGQPSKNLLMHRAMLDTRDERLKDLMKLFHNSLHSKKHPFVTVDQWNEHWLHSVEKSMLCIRPKL